MFPCLKLLADLQAEAVSMQKKRYAELQAELLRIEEEMAQKPELRSMKEEAQTRR